MFSHYYNPYNGAPLVCFSFQKSLTRYFNTYQQLKCHNLVKKPWDQIHTLVMLSKVLELSGYFLWLYPLKAGERQSSGEKYCSKAVIIGKILPIISLDVRCALEIAIRREWNVQSLVIKDFEYIIFGCFRIHFRVYSKEIPLKAKSWRAKSALPRAIGDA